ncbi:MAG: PQQ-dependent sugar dehydrogenase [Gemmatimonadota bacterium]
MRGVFCAVVVTVVASVGAPASGWSQSPSDTIVSQLETFVVDTVADGFQRPVSMAFLSTDEAILAERSPGRLSVIDVREGSVRVISGFEGAFAHGEAGFLDVTPGPRFRDDGWIYVAHTTLVANDPVAALDRIRLQDQQVTHQERLFTATESRGDTVHYGGRIAFADEYVFLSIGERYNLPEAQSLSSYNGTIVRLHLDGSVPDDNPFVRTEGALAPIWSLGHRNPQGLAMRPGTAQLWSHEHGPQGGDELNLIEPGVNYGWPLVTHGEEYGGGPIGEGLRSLPGLREPVWMWRPSIGPSDMVFHSGRGFPEWQGSVFVGALAHRHLTRLTLIDDRVVHEEVVLSVPEGRVRMVEEGPDGALFVGSDTGELLRLRPVR